MNPTLQNKSAERQLGAQNKPLQQQINYKSWRSKLKALIVTAALWGAIPFRMADFAND
jgi:hypothetical protein